MVNSEQFIGTTECLTVYTRCLITRYHYNRVRLYIPVQLRCVNHIYRKRTGNKPSLRVRGKPRQRLFQVQTPVNSSTQTELIINITAYFERYNSQAFPSGQSEVRSATAAAATAARSGAPPR